MPATEPSSATARAGRSRRGFWLLGAIAGLLMVLLGASLLLSVGGSGPYDAGPLTRTHTPTMTGQLVDDRSAVVPVGTAHLRNEADTEILIEEIEPFPPSELLEVLGIGLLSVPDDPADAWLIGTSFGFPPNVPVATDDPSGYRLAPGEGVQVVLGLRLAGEADSGEFDGIEVRYRFAGRSLDARYYNGAALELKR
jgi:hypothetical protein